MVVVCTVLLAPVSSFAAPADTQEKVAEDLHKKATAAYQSGKRSRAIELWRESQRLNPHWKYAYNLAHTLHDDGQGLQSWEFVRLSEALALLSVQLFGCAETPVALTSPEFTQVVNEHTSRGCSIDCGGEFSADGWLDLPGWRTIGGAAIISGSSVVTFDGDGMLSMPANPWNGDYKLTATITLSAGGSRCRWDRQQRPTNFNPLRVKSARTADFARRGSSSS
jgi:hypothetical protein